MDKVNIVKHTEEFHSLPCKLTNDEIAKSAEELATTLQQVESIEIEKKAVMKDYNSQIDNGKKVIHRLMTHVKNGVEYRMIKCDLQFHIAKATTIIVRTDSGEIVEERAMTDEEKQMQIEFAEDEENKQVAVDEARDTSDEIRATSIAEQVAADETQNPDYIIDSNKNIENPTVITIKFPKTFGLTAAIKYGKYFDGWFVSSDIQHRTKGHGGPVSVEGDSFETAASAIRSEVNRLREFIDALFDKAKALKAKKLLEKQVDGYISNQ